MEKSFIKDSLGMNKEQSVGQRLMNILVTSVVAFVVLVFVVGIFQGLGSGGQY
jgi:sugar phosphate permease